MFCKNLHKIWFYFLSAVQLCHKHVKILIFSLFWYRSRSWQILFKAGTVVNKSENGMTQQKNYVMKNGIISRRHEASKSYNSHVCVQARNNNGL